MVGGAGVVSGGLDFGSGLWAAAAEGKASVRNIAEQEICRPSRIGDAVHVRASFSIRTLSYWLASLQGAEFLGMQAFATQMQR
jgi:hypothetical protein